MISIIHYKCKDSQKNTIKKLFNCMELRILFLITLIYFFLPIHKKIIMFSFYFEKTMKNIHFAKLKKGDYSTNYS